MAPSSPIAAKRSSSFVESPRASLTGSPSRLSISGSPRGSISGSPRGSQLFTPSSPRVVASPRGSVVLKDDRRASLHKAPESNDAICSSSTLMQILHTLRITSTQNDRVRILTDCAIQRMYLAEQIGFIFEVLQFKEERLSAAELLAPRIVDPGNTAMALQRVTSRSEQTLIEEIFKQRCNQLTY
eukprot:TRINITY_DN9203_c0_g1_i2.p3 TRINITY_DN9203_c0_g1~~TRINITY_DN9203_c0_g1_i2.p3  ORF type:complete len:216 (+),score=41.44 TRINITY_DN9203_c0_g1_i2:95-649(+)